MKWFFHFTYEKFDTPERLWYICFLHAGSHKEAKQKAKRCMSKFKNPQLVVLKPE